MTEDLPVCETCKFKVRYSRFMGLGDGGFYCDVVCRHPDIDDTITIPSRCRNYECKHHAVSKDQKTLGV